MANKKQLNELPEIIEGQKVAKELEQKIKELLLDYRKKIHPELDFAIKCPLASSDKTRVKLSINMSYWGSVPLE